MSFFDKIPMTQLAIAAILLGLAPFSPEPHLTEKLRMLFDGTLVKAVDIFDLLMHSSLIILLAVKLIRKYTAKN
jgi:hypothetical protein